MALYAESLAAPIRRRGGRRRCVASRNGVRNRQVALLLEKQRASRLRCAPIGHGAECFDIYRDGFRRVVCQCSALRHDDGEGLADVAHLFPGYYRLLEWN